MASVLEPPAVVAGLDDLAVVRHPVQERRSHLGVAEDLGPLAEGEIRRHQHRGPLAITAKILRMALVIVVFPVPGPPVITRILFDAAAFTASTGLVRIIALFVVLFLLL